MVRYRILVASAAILTLASLEAHDPINPNVTWTGEIERLVHARCVRCHAPEGRGPMPLTTYEEARPWARAIREEVLTRRMPKWHAARGYGQFANDRSLTPFEIALFVAWVDGGAAKSRQPARGAGVPDASPGSGWPDGVKRGGAAPSSASGGVPGARSERAGVRTLTLPCGDNPVTGTLLAVKPRLERDASAGISVRLPDGRREIVAWIRDFDPEFTDTYWLRTPLVMPAGSRLLIEADGPCRIEVGLRQAASARQSRTAR